MYFLIILGDMPLGIDPNKRVLESLFRRYLVYSDINMYAFTLG